MIEIVYSYIDFDVSAVTEHVFRLAVILIHHRRTCSWRDRRTINSMCHRMLAQRVGSKLEPHFDASSLTFAIQVAVVHILRESLSYHTYLLCLWCIDMWVISLKVCFVFRPQLWHVVCEIRELCVFVSFIVQCPHWTDSPVSYFLTKTLKSEGLHTTGRSGCWTDSPSRAYSHSAKEVRWLRKEWRSVW